MDVDVKVMTHESIVHAQIGSIEKLLNRTIDCDLTLNIKGVRSNIVFQVNQEEFNRVKSELGYKIYIKKNNEWVEVSE